MAGQDQVRPARRDDPDDEPEAAAARRAPPRRPRTREVDALLEEIDEVLETNAEQFVRGFVQKGGQ